jgi:hypothetical protein
MSTKMAPVPTSLPTEAARAASTAQETTMGGKNTKRPKAARSVKGPEGHHPLRKPHEHLCSCGRLREECVRGRVRALWS